MIEAAIGQVNTRILGLVGHVRRSSLLRVATIDADATDVEVYGRTKEKAVYKRRRADRCIHREPASAIAAHG